MSFTYYETARIVFIDGDLSAEDKMYLAIHELGHIALGHIGKGNINKRNKILMDIEADNFVYSIINKNTNSSLYMLISAIVLSVSIIIGACICTITPTIQTISAPVTISQTSVTEIPKTSEVITEAVYVTPSGTRFHRQGCFYTKGKSLTKLQISEAEKKYIPCSRCNPRQ